MTLVDGESTVMIKSADDFSGRGSTVLVKFSGRRSVEPTAAEPGVEVPVDPGAVPPAAKLPIPIAGQMPIKMKVVTTIQGG